MSSAMVGRLCVLFMLFCSCSGIIYHLNETEYARMPPLYGLDDYQSCLVPANGTYCVLRVDLFTRTNNSLLDLIHEYSECTVKHYNHTYLQRGVCVTTTCKNNIKDNSIHTTEGLTKILAECLNDTIYSTYGLDTDLATLYYCERKGQHIEFDAGDWIVLGVFVAIVLINFVGTLYDIIFSRIVRDTKGNKFLLSFSIIQNWNRLISKETEEMKARRLMGLHGVRVLTIFLMFVAHVMWINSMGFSDNIHEFEELYENAYYQLIFNGMVIVQVFFVISGFLLVYNLEAYAEKNPVGWKLAPKFWIMRWWRLTPAYAVMMAFMSTWLRHLGSGPLWRLFVADSVVGDCRRYWWAHLLYINNYIADGNFCAIHTWHIATDTQLFCIGLVVYFSTRRGGWRLALGLLAALGVVLPAAHVWAWDLDGVVLLKPEFYRTMLNDTFHYMHVYGHNNIVGYAIGMGTGYLVYRLQKKGLDLSNNKICVILTWFVVPSIAALFYSGSMFYGDGPRLPLAVRMAYAALQRLITAVIVGFAILGLAMRFNTILRYFFECNVWRVPSRLSYSVYLLHLSVVHAYMGIRTQLEHVSTFNMTLLHFGMMVLTFMISLPFCLMVEAPFMRLVKDDTEQPKGSARTDTQAIGTTDIALIFPPKPS